MRDSDATPHFLIPHYPAGDLRFFSSLISERVHRFFHSPLFQAGRGSPLWGQMNRMTVVILLSGSQFPDRIFIIRCIVNFVNS